MKRIRLPSLFEREDGRTVGFSARARLLDGDEVELKGFLSAAHDGSGRYMLVDTPGACPDCSPSPVAAIQLSGFAGQPQWIAQAVCVRGRLSFGFAIDAQGNASFLRLNDARIASGLAGFG